MPRADPVRIWCLKAHPKGFVLSYNNDIILSSSLVSFIILKRHSNYKDIHVIK